MSMKFCDALPGYVVKFSNRRGVAVFPCSDGGYFICFKRRHPKTGRKQITRICLSNEAAFALFKTLFLALRKEKP